MGFVGANHWLNVIPVALVRYFCWRKSIERLSKIGEYELPNKLFGSLDAISEGGKWGNERKRS
jgi:hypothetical protein